MIREYLSDIKDQWKRNYMLPLATIATFPIVMIIAIFHDIINTIIKKRKKKCDSKK